MSEKDFGERRKHPRYPAALNASFVLPKREVLPIEDRRLAGLGRSISGRTRDISFEGFLIKANPFHADLSSFFLGAHGEGPMYVLEVDIELDGETIRTQGQVRWFKLWYTGQEPYQLEAGVFVRKMDPESRKSWDNYFERLRPQT
jgi:hypothetical protein